jgi:hypothetical protein
MKERPILFSASMVRAILAGTKTQTRRVIKPQPPTVEQIVRMSGIDYSWFRRDNERYFVVAGPVWAVRDAMFLTDTSVSPVLRCPFSVGQILWVRETWRRGDHGNLFYRADQRESSDGHRWHPSIFMPRDYSRIDLEVTEVSVQRVQEITEEDAYAEGISGGDSMGDPVGEYARLWDSINGGKRAPWASNKRAPWASNPWVWALTFKRVRKAKWEEVRK